MSEDKIGDGKNLDDLYCFATPHNGEEQSYIKILKGPLEGCIVRINSVQFAEEENSDGTLDMTIDYDWIEKPPKRKYGKKAIHETIGPIVVDILENQVKGFSGEQVEIVK